MVPLGRAVVLVALVASGHALGFRLPGIPDLTSGTLSYVVHHPLSMGEEGADASEGSGGLLAKAKGILPVSEETMFAKAKSFLPSMGASTGEGSQGLLSKAKSFIPKMGSGEWFAGAQGLVPGMPDLTELTGPSGMLHKITSPFGSFQERFSEFGYMRKMMGWMSKVFKFLHIG